MLFGEKVLTLKKKLDKVLIPHLNLKGIVKNIDKNNFLIELSEYAKTFLDTTEINIYNDNVELGENQIVFIKFNDINIEDNRLNYSSVEIYKHIKDIKMDNLKKDYFICKNDYGGFMKVNGTSFRYNDNIYFNSEYFNNNHENYFINIKNGNLLIEEIKNLIFPFKIYNMINPQETKFNEIVEIYMNK